jgi:hypothetical protein
MVWFMDMGPLVVVLLILSAQFPNPQGNSTVAIYYYQSECAGCIYLDEHVFTNSTVIDKMRSMNITLVRVNLDDPGNLRLTTLSLVVDEPAYVVTVGSSSPIDNPLRWYPGAQG